VLESAHVALHGQTVTYHRAGRGPLVLLVHGITSSSRTWREVIPRLWDDHELLAPDLLGHGTSAKPRGDYSLGAYASGIRDLLLALDLPRATVVGHSLGGGIAMQFAYQFPELVERLVLVDSGGLGREVSLLLRAATLPGAEVVVPLLASRTSRVAGRLAGGLLSGLGRQRSSADVQGLAEGFASLRDASARRAFLHTARSVIDTRGQRVDARDRLYLSAELPTLLVWGAEDPIIPLAHGERAHELMPGSRLEVFPDAGHFPFNDDPDQFAEVLRDFIATTEPVALDSERVRRLMQDARA
jgi:pimeloyl-ACP methyl ester carboxylesterase